jgi:hypothetical protein
VQRQSGVLGSSQPEQFSSKYFSNARLDIKAGAAKLKADRAARLRGGALATGRNMLWSPTIWAALLAGTPWLDVFCPGCGTSRAIDLRSQRSPSLASFGTFVLGLRC